MVEEISATELKRLMDEGRDVQLIDVRQPDENAFARIEGAKLIPLGEIIRRMDEIDPYRETVIHCKMGGRSARAIEALRSAGFTGELKNLRGGITAWSNEVDTKVPKY
jgi:rhodanese-related sulfurtransferase